MARRPIQGDPEKLRQELLDLINNFSSPLRSGDLRLKVLGLIPVYYKLQDLGSSLIPKTSASSGMERILKYMLQYPGIIIKGEELMVIAGIDDYTRRVRQLRKESGWSIISGITVKEMYEADEFPIENLDIENIRVNDYILINTDRDREAADRWHTANRIRRKNLSVKDKLLEYFLENVGKVISGEELRYVSSDRTEWARRSRELRTQEGWPVKTRSTGRPDLKVGEYILEENKQSEVHDRNIPDIVRIKVLERDQYCCRKCGWSHDKRTPHDPRHLLELHHIKHHKHGGENIEENLVTLCNVDHDYVHAKGKAWSKEDFIDWLSKTA